MSKEIIREWNFWLASMGVGACMAFSYDLLRLFRRLFRHGRAAVDLEDILYWTACFFLSFALLYYGNNGVIRFAAVLGTAVGMTLYAMTLGRFFVKISFWLIDRTAGSLLRLAAKLFRPARRCIVKLRRRVKLGLSSRLRLTVARFRHRIRIRHLDQKRKKKGKEEARHGKKDTGHRKRKTKKDAGISPQKEREPAWHDRRRDGHCDHDRGSRR